MPSPKIRKLVEKSLEEGKPEAVALAIGKGLHERGAIPRSRAWVQAILVAIVVAALDRSAGNPGATARAICGDLAYRTQFHLARHGWFDDDPLVGGKDPNDQRHS